MSDTPRTDKIKEDYGNAPDPCVKGYMHRYAKLCRELERENNELRKGLGPRLSEDEIGLLDRFSCFAHQMPGCGMQLPDEDEAEMANRLCELGLLENRGAGELQWMDEHENITVQDGVIVPAYRITEAGERALSPSANDRGEPRH